MPLQGKIGWRSSAGATGSTTTVSSLLLDTYSGAAAAYSLRRLRTAYTGSAIRVRRSSDNTELNIGFDSDGNLDTYALSAFVGTGNGFVTTWYDQSGNGRDATQTTAGNQPQIVLNGVVNTFNNKPCVKFDGSNDFIQSSYAAGTSNELYFVTQTTDTSFLFPRGITGYGFVADQGNTSTNTSSYFTTPTQLYVNSVLSSPANRGAVYNLLNGYKLSVHKGADISNNFNYLRFGSFIQDGNFDFNGNLFEWVIYPTLQASQSSIESNINTYYSIYPNPTSVWNLLTAVYNADATGSSSLKTSLFAAYNGESNANDSFGSNNGTANGGLTYGTGKIGNAFQFNGTNSYVSLPDNSLNFTSKFSYSFWAKSNNTTDYGVVVGNMQSSRSPFGFFHGYEVSLESGKVYFYFRSGINTQIYHYSTNVVNNGNWNHIVVTYDPTNTTTGAKIYVNGTLDVQGATLGVSNPIGYTSPMKACIGARNHSGSPVNLLPNGTSIDALNIYQKELTQSEITELYNSGNGAQYIGDNFYKPTTNDALLVNNGTAQGGLTYGLGKVGTAFQFNGTNANILVSNGAWNFTGNFSISMWVKFSSSGLSQILISNFTIGGATTVSGWFVEKTSTELRFRGYNNGTLVLNATKTAFSPSTSVYTHLVFTRSSANSKIYIDGVLDTTSTATGAPNYESTNYPMIGANKYNSTTYQEFFNGNIDALNVWNKELTQTEITELYNSGNGKQYPN